MNKFGEEMKQRHMEGRLIAESELEKIKLKERQKWREEVDEGLMFCENELKRELDGILEKIVKLEERTEKEKSKLRKTVGKLMFIEYLREKEKEGRRAKRED